MEKVGVLEIIQLAERVEVCAEKFYIKMADQADSLIVGKVFRIIAAQEKKHQQTYAELLRQTGEELRRDPREIFAQPAKSLGIEEILNRFHPDLKARLEKFTRCEDRAESLLFGGASSALEAVELAIVFEETSIELYRELQKHVTIHSKSRVEIIINEEKRHLRDFISLKAKILKTTAHHGR
ncbi:MAG: hypothetical protein A2X94_05770 [Bdellovibrionales bacterium GWB1_55_8]|nr:MAG: hypothetical protein A2X94_05770 [Bdellovibrionales bacterium GWB1_55_8]